MYIVQVHIQVKSDSFQGFIAATIENARNSLSEKGIVRFDLYQEIDDPCRFVLLEAYCQENDTYLHKETEHYLKWRDTVAPMLADTRWSKKYINIFPSDDNWS